MSGFHDAGQTGVTIDSADYIVIGSGAGGGAAARVLAEAGYGVVVLEDGPFVTRDKLTRQASESMAMLMRNRGHMATVASAAMPMLQGRCVGGTTFVNSAIIWRLPEKVLARWQGELGLADGLPTKALEDAYQTIERDMNIRQVAEHTATASDVMMDRGARLAGIESRQLFRNEKDCQGSGRCVHGCPNDAKQSTAINYLRRAVNAKAHVFAHAKAQRIITEQGRATGVVVVVSGEGPYTRKEITIRARRGVIVAGSVFGSPYILRRSGIARDSRALGRHFMAHPGLAVGGIYPEPVNMWSGASQGYEAYGLRDTLGLKFETINVPPEIAASRLPGAGARLQRYLDLLPNLGLWAVAVRADAEGTVSESRFLGDFVRYMPTLADMDRVRQGIKKLAEMHFLAGAKEVLPGVHGLPESFTSPDQIKLLDDIKLTGRHVSMLATHLFGTCRAGVDPKTSVVNPQLKVHGVDGLYVMDASVFPTNTGVNPQHSIMAIATVAARRVAEDVLRPAIRPAPQGGARDAAAA